MANNMSRLIGQMPGLRPGFPFVDVKAQSFVYDLQGMPEPYGCSNAASTW